MKAGFWKSVGAAFSAKPPGLFIPPNWIGLATVGLLGLLNPGAWVIGMGVELAYLFALASSSKFQIHVGAAGTKELRLKQEEELKAKVNTLDYNGRDKYYALKTKCSAILTQYATSNNPYSAHQTATLNKLVWMYLTLLTAKVAMEKAIKGAIQDARALDEKLKGLQARIDDTTTTDDVKKSLVAQKDIIVQRKANQVELKHKQQLVEAQLGHVEEQVDLIREQSAMALDPADQTTGIENISDCLKDANDWMKERKEIFGALDDSLSEVPSILDFN